MAMAGLLTGRLPPRSSRCVVDASSRRELLPAADDVPDMMAVPL
jgi:hypothetical protein